MLYQMERSNYDRTTISVFDTVGSFFVDVFYNNHYLFSRDMVKSGRATSITDAYRSTIVNYMSGISSRKDLYITVAKSLHEYYQKSSGFGSIVFSDFEDKFLSQFIPPEYYRDFTERIKDNTLHEIIICTVNEFGAAILGKDFLRRVIDDHLNTNNVTFLQDRIVDIFIIQRENYYSKFVQEISKSNSDNTVTKQLVEKLKQEFVTEKKRRCEAESDRDRALNIISQLVARVTNLETVAKEKAYMSQLAASQLAASQLAASQQRQSPPTQPYSEQMVPPQSISQYSNAALPIHSARALLTQPVAPKPAQQHIVYSAARDQSPIELPKSQIFELEDSEDSGSEDYSVNDRQREMIAKRLASTQPQEQQEQSDSTIFDDPGFG